MTGHNDSTVSTDMQSDSPIFPPTDATPAHPAANAGDPPPGISGPSVSVPYTFSARTCLELVDSLTPTQIDTELEHLMALNSATKFPHETTNTELKRSLLYRHLSKTLCGETDKIVSNFHSLLSNVSRSCVGHEDGILSQTSSPVAEETGDNNRNHPVAGKTLLTPPVSFVDIDLSDINIDEVERTFTFSETQRGGRETIYYGQAPYQYGTIRHEASPYPNNNSILDTIFERIGAIYHDFTPSNYSCLLTRYANGRVTVPMHSDNEKCLAPNSNIFTVSFGTPRTVKFRSTVGPPTEKTFSLTNGTVHVMTSGSQDQWKHGIEYEPAVLDSRVSLTFRREHTPAPETRIPVPPISPNMNSDKTGLKRVLFITDSVFKNTPEFVFENTGSGHSCVKRVNYQLADIDGFSPEFHHADIVLISCGINDLARYGKTANTLADIMESRFREYSVRFPQTKFIFNSLLRCRGYPWLNSQVRQFNAHMYELSNVFRNLCFFDSDKLVDTSGLSLKDIFISGRDRAGLTERSMMDSQSNDGIHITLRCRKMVTEQMANAVGNLASWKGTRFQQGCEWLYNVTTRRSWAG